MVEKVLAFCKQENLIENGDLVVAGISGGADSVCLLFVLLELQKKIRFDIHVVHVNHGIREEAGEDAAYVKKLCAENNIGFTLVECKVEEYAKTRHMSCEEAGREVRYDAFYKALKDNAKKNQKGKIAIAHNENDLAETFMFNLFRGSGLKGLSGIQAKREEIIRPLLCVSRAEIEEYLNNRNISFVTDRTNLTDDYTRNKIRHHILPEAENMVQNAIGHIKEASEKIDEAYELLNMLTKENYDKCVIKIKDDLLIKEKEFNPLQSTMKKYVIKLALETKADKSKDLTAVHVEELVDLMNKQTGRCLSLPYNIEARREYEGIRLVTKSSKIDKVEWEYQLSEVDYGKEISLPNNDKLVVNIRDFSVDDLKNIPTNSYTKWLDYDKIIGSVSIRNRRQGDYFILNEQGNKKTLKTYFIDEKIPAKERDNKYLLADDIHVICILKDRIGYDLRVDETTRRILVVNYIQG